MRRLVEYEQMKLAAHRLDALPQAERAFEWVEVCVEKSLYQRLPDVSPDDLRDAWNAILRQAKLHTRHIIQREELSVREHMGLILRSLRDAGGFVDADPGATGQGGDGKAGREQQAANGELRAEGKPASCAFPGGVRGPEVMAGARSRPASPASSPQSGFRRPAAGRRDLRQPR